MSDYSKSKEYRENVYPVESHFTSSLLTRIEPILTPELLRARYLIGVNLTNYTDDILKDRIVLAMNNIEVMLDVPLVKTQYRQRIPFDRDLYRSSVYTKVNVGPILSVDDMRIESSNADNIYTIPPRWIEMGYAHKRQINIIPFLNSWGTSYTASESTLANAGAIFLGISTYHHWLPAYWTITYTAGISKVEGQLPIVVNELIGMIAAIELLSQIQTNYLYNSHSMGQDGITQSSSGQGPNTYAPRIAKLQDDFDKKLAKLKTEFSTRIFFTNL